MTQALAVSQRSADLSTSQIALAIVKSGFFQDSVNESQAITKILAGDELGFGPIASMQGVYLVKGRVTLAANLVGAAIQRSGKYGYEIEELTNERCVLRFYRRADMGANIPRRTFDSIFTIDDARTAGLLSNATYQKFPRNMLFARALTNGARFFCPEVFNGPVYTPDELGAVVNEEGIVIDGSTGEVLRESAPAGAQPATVIEQLERPELTLDDTEAIDDARSSWAAAIEEAARLGVKHKELPADAPLWQIERWTIALQEKLESVAQLEAVT